jgi:hypothetical protein
MLLKRINKKFFISHHIDSDIIYGNITISSSNNTNLTDRDNNKGNASNQKHFVLCESCFWCATCLVSRDETVSKCPICNNLRVKSLSIDENYI